MSTLRCRGHQTIDRLARDKATVRTELERRRRVRRVITNGDAAALVGSSARRIGKVLTAFRAVEPWHGRPDLGAAVVRMSTGLPSHVGPGQQARDRAIAVREAVFTAWV